MEKEQTIYVVMLDNGEADENHEVKHVAAFSSRELAKRFVKDNSPITNEMYFSVFLYPSKKVVFDVRFSIRAIRFHS